MRRIYFLVPDLKTASTVTDELLLARIEERHIHIVAPDGTELGDLPKASLLQTSDLIPAVERGLAVGGVTGILAGVAAVSGPRFCKSRSISTGIPLPANWKAGERMSRSRHSTM